MRDQGAGPRKTLSAIDGIALVIGIVVGTGIFKTPSLVAANTGSEFQFLSAWILGGLVSLAGALCYAELAITYPHSGGDYHYLARTFGPDTAFLFGWARMSVIQPGSIALLAFVFGDYLSPLLSPAVPPPLCAILAITSMTALNVAGTRQGSRTQNLLTAAKVAGLAAVVAAGTVFAPAFPVTPAGAPPADASFGLGMVFVLLTFGGWNEAAYLSAELRAGKRTMLPILLGGVGAITAIYLLVGFAYLRGMGLPALGRSEVAAADLMRKVFGGQGAGFVSILIAISALGAINATILTGARTNYALGRDFPLFGILGRWQERANTPANALLLQGAVASALVLLGGFTRRGFVTMVEYTAPVFWLFFLLTGVSLFVLRRKEPEVPRSFTVPLYPFTPLLFCAMCAYMLQASIAYTGRGALAGLVVLFTGLLFLLLARSRQKNRGIPDTLD